MLRAYNSFIGQGGGLVEERAQRSQKLSRRQFFLWALGTHCLACVGMVPCDLVPASKLFFGD